MLNCYKKMHQQEELGDKDRAMQFFEEYAYDELKKIADMLRRIMKLELYRITPDLFDKLVNRFFCKSDDITYGDMHPGLVWGRTQTLETGGSCCGFKLHLK